MMRALKFVNFLLVLASGLLTLLGTYVSLLPGMHPLLALLILFFWTAVSWLSLRLTSATPKLVHWRTTIPSLLLLVNLAFFAGTFELLRQQHIREYGPPRRYYSWDTTE